MSSYLVTGGGRGLGLEMVTQLSNLPESEVSVVFAATRSSPPDALEQLIERSKGRVVHIGMVVTEKESVTAAAAEVEKVMGGKGLDVLINNAGVLPIALGGVASMDNLAEGLKVNVEGTHLTTAAFLPVLRKGQQKKVFNM
jgi:NAD(P)-dependent dehydrogenase (short-subunit alcohol dehydrogenase family)